MFKCQSVELRFWKLTSLAGGTLIHREELNVPSSTYEGSKCVMSCKKIVLKMVHLKRNGFDA